MKMFRRNAIVAGTLAAIVAGAGTKSAAGAKAQTGTDQAQKSGNIKLHFDTVIVGGGSAGAVLAARLRAVSARRTRSACASVNPGTDVSSGCEIVPDPCPSSSEEVAARAPLQVSPVMGLQKREGASNPLSSDEL